MTNSNPRSTFHRAGNRLRSAALVPFVLALLSSSAFAATTVFPESAMIKVKPDAAAKTPRPMSIAAARNEFESFQVVVKADGAGQAGVTPTASALTGTDGAVIPATAISLYKAELINLGKASGSIGKAGIWPDALVPAVDEIDGQPRNAFPMTVLPNQARAIWVDVLVPKDAKAGKYTGSITVTGTGMTETVPLELEVWDFELPSTPTLASAFLANSGAICHAHGVDCNDPAAAAALMGKYERMALEHRITLPNIWVVKPGGGDWTQFDQSFGPLLDGTASTRLAGAKMTTAQYTWGDRSIGTLKDFAAHFTAKGWFDRVYDYTADEPPYGSQWSDISARAAQVKAADPAWKTLVTTNIDEASKNGVTGKIDIMVPIVNHMESTSAPYVGDQRPKYDAYAAGKQLWMYQSCMSQGCSFGGSEPGASWPSYMIDVSATKNRVMQWANYKEGVTGELYWETAGTFDRDPWADQFQFGGNGDGTLFYPGTTGRIGGTSGVPVASIRLKMVREGVEDFEYLSMLAKLGDATTALALAKQVMPTAYSASDDPNGILVARAAAAKQILHLLGKDVAPPPATPTPPATPPAEATPPTQETPPTTTTPPTPTPPTAACVGTACRNGFPNPVKGPLDPLAPGAPVEEPGMGGGGEGVSAVTGLPPTTSSQSTPLTGASGCSSAGGTSTPAMIGMALAGVARMLKRRKSKD